MDQAAERYGVRPRHADFREMVLTIIATVAGDAPNPASFVQCFGQREVWDVPIGEYVVRVVYEPETSSIITCLPPADS